jgi:hypothetical protein
MIAKTKTLVLLEDEGFERHLVVPPPFAPQQTTPWPVRLVLSCSLPTAPGTHLASKMKRKRELLRVNGRHRTPASWLLPFTGQLEGVIIEEGRRCSQQMHRSLYVP